MTFCLLYYESSIKFTLVLAPFLTQLDKNNVALQQFNAKFCVRV